MRKQWFIAMLTIILAGCTADESTEVEATLDIDANSWRLLEFQTGDQRDAADASETTLSFNPDLGKATGSSGCNQFSADYSLDGQKITIGTIGISRRLCVDPMIMAQEQRFLEFISAAQRLSLDDQQLTIQVSDSRALLFVAQEAAEQP